MAVELTADVPTVADARAFVKVPETALPDVDLTRMLAAAVAVVAEGCRVPVDDDGDPDTDTAWPAPLVEAIFRRIQRSIAAKGLPLGFMDSASEYGPARIPAYDVLIEELEGKYRRVVFG